MTVLRNARVACGALTIILMAAGCSTVDARGPAIEAASVEFAGVQERVERELSHLPATGFVEFIDGGGLKIGWSGIGDERIEFAGGSGSFVFAASETEGIGVVDAVVIGVGDAGSGDLYDSARVYACFEVTIDIEAKSVVRYDDLTCPMIVLGPLAADEDVDLSDLT